MTVNVIYKYIIMMLMYIKWAYTYLVVGRTLFTNRNMAFSLGRFILLLMMYMNCATVSISPETMEEGHNIIETHRGREGGK